MRLKNLIAIYAVFGIQGVVACAAIQGVTSGSTNQEIIATPATNNFRSFTDVLSLFTIQSVIIRTTIEGIIGQSAKNLNATKPSIKGRFTTNAV